MGLNPTAARIGLLASANGSCEKYSFRKEVARELLWDWPKVAAESTEGGVRETEQVRTTYMATERILISMPPRPTDRD